MGKENFIIITFRQARAGHEYKDERYYLAPPPPRIIKSVGG